MDILSGAGSVEEFQKAFTEAFNDETSDLTPEEFRAQVRLSVHQRVFAEQFAQQAPTAWKDLLFLKEIAVRGLTFHIRRAISKGEKGDELEVTEAQRLLHLGIVAWMRKYGTTAPWVHAMAFVTVRAAALTEFFNTDPPATLLHNAFPTVVIENGNVALGQSSFGQTPMSSVIVCADLGMQEWDTLGESQTAFRNRMVESFTKELDAQLGRVDSPLLAKDLEAKRHWIDMTIDRYAGHLSERATAEKHNVSRPAVSKAVEATRKLLGFAELSPEWAATRPRPWRLHVT